jgi:hypothetical protein
MTPSRPQCVKYVGSLKTNDTRCISEIKSMIANGKSDIQQEHFFCHQKTVLTFMGKK